MILKFQDFVKEGLWSKGVDRSMSGDTRLEKRIPTNKEWVDMGVAGKWAKCNVGAQSPEDYGLFFAWGDIDGCSEDSKDKVFNWYHYKFCKGDRDSLTKYNTRLRNGDNIDDLTELQPEDDAAFVIMGKEWKTPTEEEYHILFDACDNNYIENYNDTGINGLLLTLKNDETKQLFFPSTGFFNGIELHMINRSGAYWASTIDKKFPYYAGGLSFTDNKPYKYVCGVSNNMTRFSGHTIRGILK